MIKRRKGKGCVSGDKRGVKRCEGSRGGRGRGLCGCNRCMCL